MSAAPTGALFYEPRVKPLSTTGQQQPGAYYQFYLTGTTTSTPVYADGELSTILSQTPGTGGTTAASDGRLVPIYLDPDIIYRVQLYSAVGVLLEDTDPYVPLPLSTFNPTAQQLGAILYPQTAAELFAGLTPVSNVYPTGNALRWGVDPTGTVDSTSAIQNWIDATWAMYHYQDGQGLWNGGGGAAPVLTLPPGKYMVSNTMYLPSGITLKGTGHPANTVSHTRIIMNSTGVAPARTWMAGMSVVLDGNVNPGTGLGTYYFQATTPGVAGSSAPSWLTAQSPGATLTDGTIVWTAQAPMTSGDNRNNPMFQFRRGTLPPSLGNGVLQNSACTSTIQELEFWCVTLGVSTFNNPLAGIGIELGDYPNGGHFNFDVDTDDFRFKDCVFQNSPAAIRANGVGLVPTIRPDGFPGDRGLGIFFENCEFDASGAHFYIQNSYLDFYIEDCEFFGAIHRYEGCSGNVRYQGGDMSGNTYIDALSVDNAFNRFFVKGVTMEPVSNFPQVGINFLAGSPPAIARIVDISENTFDLAATVGGISVIGANSGRVCGNTLNDQGFNAPAGTGVTNFIAAINLGECQNLLVSENNITATDTSGATYNGFGILTWSVSILSQNNFITNNAISAPYNGATFNGQDRQINLATGDIRGINFDPNRSPPSIYAGPIVSNAAVTVFNNPAVSQLTGWGSPSGATQVANFPGATATLVQCSETIAEILNTLKAIGYYAT